MDYHREGQTPPFPWSFPLICPADVVSVLASAQQRDSRVLAIRSSEQRRILNAA